MGDAWSFDDRAGTYDRLQWVHDEAFLDTMGKLISSQGRARARIIVDLATGTGAVAHFLASPDNLVLGLDLSWPMLAQAAARSGSSNERFVQAAGELIPIKDGVVDLAVCRNGLHQMSNPREALREVRRALGPSGALCVIESVAPSAEVKPEWRRILMLKDRGRHPDFAFTAEELQAWIRNFGYEILGVASHEVEFDVDEWTTMGGVVGERAVQVRHLFGALGSEATRAMAVRSEKGRLYASKLSHMVLAKPL